MKSMNDGDALLQAILDDPEDNSVRLIYADWLDDQGDHDRAEFIRVQVELANPISVGTAGSYAEAKFLVDLHRAELERREWELLGGKFHLWTPPVESEERGYLMTSELTVRVRTSQAFDDDIALSFCRGFVGAVRCPLQAWLYHGAKLVRAQPIVRVEVSGVSLWRDEAAIDGQIEGGWWDAEGSGNDRVGDIPPALFNIMWEQYVDQRRQDDGGRWLIFKREDVALDALSDAAIDWAKSQAPEVKSQEGPKE